MIEFIKKWGTALICAAFISAICNTLLPQNSLSKVARFVVGLFLILTILYPFAKNRDFLFDFSLDNISEIALETSTNEALILEETNRMINARLAELLAEQGIPAAVESRVKIVADNRILFEEIIIYITNEQQTRVAEIEQIISEQCYLRPQVVVKGTP